MESAIHVELEAIYTRLKDGGFLSALEALGRLLPSGEDRAVSRAVDTYLKEFFRHDHADSPHEAQILEKLLLDRSERIELGDTRREEVILRLVRMHESEPELAASYARFQPDHPVCRNILEVAGPAASARVTAAGAPVSVERVGGSSKPSPDSVRPDEARPVALRSLYRSDLERRFHRAVVEVFPHFLAVPNAAVQAVVDFEAVKDHLTEQERTYFFRALIDVVVFDPQREMRPVYLFEVDSPYHDDADAKHRDEMKNRIIDLAGARLYRLRPADHRSDPAVFAAAIRRITREE